ncbi:MAG: hypothetical protein J6O01_04965 [Bacteroidales bacterium]|nr:hypothetical protein [Bacteroidales bacterium]
MRTPCILLAFLAMVLPVTAGGALPAPKGGCVIVTDYLKADGKKDVSDILQSIIDNNPNRTIFFPDGTYLLSKPIQTPADPEKSVSLWLASYAILKADDGWKHEEAMVRLGGKDPCNNITINGSNYFLDGGIIDGNGVAVGVSVDSGRETVIRNVSIKHVRIGIQINHGANSGSSDCDVHNVNIVGNKAEDSIGVLVIGYDNTFANMRIAAVHYGFKIRSQGNAFRNIHPLYTSGGYESGEYESSCGFLDESGGNNFYSQCYSDQFSTAFQTNGGHVVYSDCFCMWYSSKGKKHVAFKSVGKFNATVSNMTVGAAPSTAAPENIVLETAEEGGRGSFTNLFVQDDSILTDHVHERYMR